MSNSFLAYLKISIKARACSPLLWPRSQSLSPTLEMALPAAVRSTFPKATRLVENIPIYPGRQLPKLRRYSVERLYNTDSRDSKYMSLEWLLFS
jgi:hypothetical protein